MCHHPLITQLNKYYVIVHNNDLLNLMNLILQGCVDHFEKCQIWSRAGHCTTNPLFMFFNCRESCGSCGLKSRKLEISKVPKDWFVKNRTKHRTKTQLSLVGFFYESDFLKVECWTLIISAQNEEKQIVDGKQYTDVSSRDFSKFFFHNINCFNLTIFLICILVNFVS